MFGIATPVRINPVRVVSIANANREKMGPDFAALSDMLSPIHLSVPCSFPRPFIPLCKNRRGRNESPYGLSQHCLLSTDSLIPLLPIGEGHHIHQAIEPAIYETDSVSRNSSTQLEPDIMDRSESPELRIPEFYEVIPKSEPSESSASPGAFPQVIEYIHDSIEHELILQSTCVIHAETMALHLHQLPPTAVNVRGAESIRQDAPHQRYVCSLSEIAGGKLMAVQSSTTLQLLAMLSLHQLRPDFLIRPPLIVLVILLRFFPLQLQSEHVP